MPREPHTREERVGKRLDSGRFELFDGGSRKGLGGERASKKLRMSILGARSLLALPTRHGK